MKYILILILFSSPALATERNKRDFVPITPIAIITGGKYLELNDKTDSQQRGGVDMPKHDPKRIYYGPAGDLFPKLDLNFDKEND